MIATITRISKMALDRTRGTTISRVNTNSHLHRTPHGSLAPTIEMIRAIDLTKQQLPNLPRIDVPGGYRLVEDGDASTAATKLPKVFETFSSDLKSCYESPLLQRVLAKLLLVPMTIEGCRLLANEGDVRGASSLYLIHDVNLIIEKVLDEKGIGAGSLTCRSPPWNSDRPDLVWQFSPDRDLLQLKYKNARMLRGTDWDPIFTNSGMVVLDFKPGGKVYDDDDNIVKYLFCSSDDDNWTFRQLLLAVIIYSFRKEGILAPHARRMIRQWKMSGEIE
ncbi:uncharacterized protein EV420DRAFT_1745492 [Desarmillaria tabescens]|uniref:Uncharacterized protein n=1 Tax=Armillaria tabescens TaxID=1929756 RepID=A0AA39NC41_ARMTA|nr:uncharacterized protein EV420DRAFT_1745492 [Desarmillaria tabescens]KAK0462918.1 hypothetical protein EV420DRAFT_1745492 [Desarmillaria tabescens]